MKISELVKELLAMQVMHGDLDVWIDTNKRRGTNNFIVVHFEASGIYALQNYKTEHIHLMQSSEECEYNAY